jgi:hypothetical protein
MPLWRCHGVSHIHSNIWAALIWLEVAIAAGGEDGEDGDADAEDVEDGVADAEDGEHGVADAEDGEYGVADAEDGEDGVALDT